MRLLRGCRFRHLQDHRRLARARLTDPEGRHGRAQDVAEAIRVARSRVQGLRYEAAPAGIAIVIDRLPRRRARHLDRLDDRGLVLERWVETLVRRFEGFSG